MRVTLLEVVSAARLRVASLAAESAGYILLAVADQVAAAPRRVSLSGVDLGDEGKVRLSTGEPSTEPAAEAELRALLEQLLHVASSSTPALGRVARQVDLSGLAGLVRELEAALIPVNRAAAQRALARLARETIRAIERGLEVREEQSRVESPLVAALLVTPAPAPEPRRYPAVLPPSLALREVSSPSPPVARKLALNVPPAPIPSLEMPIAPARLPPARVAAAEVVRAQDVEPDFEVEVEVELEEERPPREAETRPEPVVRRSTAPLAPPAPPVSNSPVETPRLGTLVAVAAVFQEGPAEYDLTERMPPVALIDEESSGDLDAVEPVEASANEPVEASVVEASSDEPDEASSDEPVEASSNEPVEASVVEASSNEPVEATSDEPVEASSNEPVEATSDEPVEASVVEASSNEPVEASSDEPEPLSEDDLIEEIPLEMALALDAEPVPAPEAVEELPDASIELAFTPSPHRPATLTLEALRGPTFEPEPDYDPEPLPVYELEPEPEPTPPSLPRVQLRREPLRSDVDDLLRGFRNETGPSEPELSRELRMLAGLDLTPPPTTAGER